MFVLMISVPVPAGMSPTGQRTAAVALLMIGWWITEAVPIPVTSLLPLALFPLLGILDAAKTAAPYADQNIYLFLGGFCIAMAMQKWNLHKRVALLIVARVGGRPRQLVLGFMVATAFLSMWVSNSATAMMMMPIGLALVTFFAGPDEAGPTAFGAALMLGIAYAASIGGIATLIGTPPNLVFAGQVRALFPNAPEIGFVQWMKIGVPFMVVFLPIAWLYLTFVAFRPGKAVSSGREVVRKELAALGPLSRGEKLTLAVFTATCAAWIFRQDLNTGVWTVPGWTGLFPWARHIQDSTVAVIGALLLFVLPVDIKKHEFVLDWTTAVKLPWGILLLFGGGFALAEGFMSSGLADWIGANVRGLAGLPLLALVAGACLLTMALTEVTSNTATATMFLPVMATMAVSLGLHPFALMIPSAVSASCAFMLPVSTPPNAIVFGSGQLTIPQMARAGVILNLIAAVVITTMMGMLAESAFGFRLDEIPRWAR